MNGPDTKIQTIISEKDIILDTDIKKQNVTHENNKETKAKYKIDDSGGISGVDTFEDLLEMIGPNGKWNIITIVVCCFASSVLPFQSITYQFLGKTPDHWCHVKELVNANWTREQIFDIAIPTTNNVTETCKMYNYNYTLAAAVGYEKSQDRNLISLGVGDEIIYCSSRDYDTSEFSSTLVTEFDLVCDRRALYSTTQAASQFGVLIGVLGFGFLMDIYGRRPIVLICVVMSLIFGLAAAASPVFPLYIVCKTLVSCFYYGYFTGCFVYLMEIFSPSQRSSVGSLGGIPWTLGYMLTPAIAYLIRPWRWMQTAYSLPVVICFSYYWFLPESPRWLITHRRYQEAVEVLSKAAKMNGITLPPSDAIIESMKRMSPPQEEKITSKGPLHVQILNHVKHFFILLIRRDTRVKILISCFCWCAVSMVYYGVSLNSENLSTDPYMYVFLGGLAEIPSYVFMWPMVVYLGRKFSFSILYVLSGITISIIAILLATMEEVPYALLMVLSLGGKITITAAFHVAYVYTAELFPTRYRSLAVGQSSMMARVGSISSPYINDLLGDAISWGPSALFGIMSLVAAALSLLLPETRDVITEDVAERSTDKEKGNGIPLQQAKVNEAFEET